MAKYNLLTSPQMQEKYQELHGLNFQFPYTIIIDKQNQYLYFLGCHHSRDLYDSQFDIIEKLFSEFTSKTLRQDDVVMIEGGGTPIIWGSIHEAIQKDGEHGLAAYLAHTKSIFCYSPEPTDEEEVVKLLRQFTQDEIVYYYFARTVSQWQRHKDTEPKNLEQYVIERLTRWYKSTPGLENYDYSYEHFKQLHDKTHDHPFDPDSKDCFYADSNPIFNEVSEASSTLRDTHIINEILKHWKQGENIFVVYGSGHAIKQEPALRELLQ